MFDLTILEVVIGLAFVYLLLSLVVSGISEIIAQWLSMRANNLETWVRKTLGEESQSFYNHPLIQGLTGKKGFLRKIPKPSYIPGRTFALVFKDLMDNLPADGSEEEWADVEQPTTGLPASDEPVPDPSRLLSSLTSKQPYECHEHARGGA